ncbi:MAG: hypothetical protein HFJ10_12170 [Lachnospiraceae bacterium]|nr:hypothetical protein [Lachnospiraceae bacterium]
MLKIMGALMILASATGIGVSCSMDLKKYCMELRLLKQLLYMLRGEIKYTKTPLAEAFERIAVRLPEPFSTFLRQTAQEMENLDGRTFGELWREQIRTGLPGTHLKKDDKEQLGALGEVLGYLDLEMQVSSIELYLEQLEISIRSAQDAITAKQKLYQSLGVAGGIFLVILLV